jgi:hypothetical protein
MMMAQEQKAHIQGGVEGRVKSVDHEGMALTITTTQGRERTFKITDETEMLGPRGGKVRRKLRDPRFHEGLMVTVVADGNTRQKYIWGTTARLASAQELIAPRLASQTPAMHPGGQHSHQRARPMTNREPRRNRHAGRYSPKPRKPSARRHNKPMKTPRSPERSKATIPIEGS